MPMSSQSLYVEILMRSVKKLEVGVLEVVMALRWGPQEWD